MPLSSFIAAPGSWFYWGDNYSDAGGLAGVLTIAVARLQPRPLVTVGVGLIAFFLLKWWLH